MVAQATPTINATVVFNWNWQASIKLLPDGKRKYRYIINSGSSRSSKTFSIIQLFYLYAIQHPGKKLSVFRDTKQICKQTVLEDMRKVYPTMPGFSTVVFNVTESIFKFANGSSIHIEGTDDSVKIHGYHCDVLWINEGYNVSEDTFNQLDMRCADFVILDLNPRQSHWSEHVATRENAKLIHSTFRDNPFCPPEQRKKILSYQPVSRCALVERKALQEQAARAYDIINNPAGYDSKEVRELARCRTNEDNRSADVFNWDVYGLGKKGERPNRIFHFEEISDEDYTRLSVEKYYGVDWGDVDPWGILECKYYDGGLYFRELNYESGNKMRERLTDTDRAQVDGSPEGLVTWLFRKLDVDPRCAVVCDNNRITKVTALRDAGYWAHYARKEAGSIIDGIDILNNMKVYYTRSSINFAYEQENYSRKVDRYGVVLEEPEDINNHLMDCARYVALYLRWAGIIQRI